MSRSSRDLSPLFSSGKDDWETPADLFADLLCEFDFTIDGAAGRTNHLLPRWYGPGSTIAEDALDPACDWAGERVFCNPPYSMVAEFVEKAAAEARRGAFTALLIPARTDTRYWQTHIWDGERHTWRLGVQGRFLKGRLKFVDPIEAEIQLALLAGGVDEQWNSNSAPFPSALILFGTCRPRQPSRAPKPAAVGPAGVAVGDVLEVDPGGLFHAVLCDPPYHLTSGNRSVDWDSFKQPNSYGVVNHGTTNKTGRGGFMGKAWDGGDLAYRLDTWARIGESLHPGGFLMAFASSRGWHRLACALEDAGFIIHPTLFGWAYGSGFPKATRVPDERFAGHRYGLQALKPALEPIIVAQKPYAGKPKDSITRTGAGALWIDGGRIGTSESLAGGAYSGGVRPTSSMGLTGEAGGRSSMLEAGGGRLSPSSFVQPSGRWPSNLVLLHRPLCVCAGTAWTCAPGCPVAALDQQSGESTSGIQRQPLGTGGIWNSSDGRPCGPQYGDSGTASRFFYQVQTALDDADPICYMAKASRTERDAGLEGGRSPHPTHKPIDLTRYLAALLLPPPSYAPRRIYVPFAGVGSEMIGAMLAGWEDVVGVEQDADYAALAARRIAYWRRAGATGKKGQSR